MPLSRNLVSVPVLRRLALPLLLALSLSACVVVPSRPVAPYGGGVVVVPTAPPPLPREVVPAQPGPGYVWIPGHWNWSGHRHVWQSGHWSAPRRGQVWVPRRWVPGPGGHHQHGGHWDSR
jgi:hypothetical protein